MKNKSFLLVLLLFFLLMGVVTLVGCGSGASTTQGEEETSLEAEAAACLTRATYLYRFNEWDNAAKISSLKKLGINTVFLSTTAKNLPGGPFASTAYTAKLIDFLTKAKAAFIAVHLLAVQTYEDAYTINHPDALERIKLAVDFCRNNPALAVAGVSIDVEPHALPEWKNNPAGYGDGVREGIMRQYVLLLSKIRIFLNGPDGLPGLKFSAAVGWWYNSRALDGTVPSAAAANLGKYVDFIIPMAYDLSPAVAKQVGDEIAAAPTMAAIKVNNFSNYKGVLDQVNSLITNFKLQKNYRGVIIFEFSDLEAKYSR